MADRFCLVGVVLVVVWLPVGFHIPGMGKNIVDSWPFPLRAICIFIVGGRLGPAPGRTGGDGRNTNSFFCLLKIERTVEAAGAGVGAGVDPL